MITYNYATFIAEHFSMKTVLGVFDKMHSAHSSVFKQLQHDKNHVGWSINQSINQWINQ